MRIHRIIIQNQIQRKKPRNQLEIYIYAGAQIAFNQKLIQQFITQNKTHITEKPEINPGNSKTKRNKNLIFVKCMQRE